MEMNSNRHSGWRRWARRFAWALAMLLLVGILLRLSLKTDVVQGWVKNLAVSTANQQLNARLSVDKLSGDLWDEVTISGIQLVQEDTVAQIDSVHTSYNIWSFLGGHIELSQLHIYQPKANLRQQDGRWNVQDIMPQSEETSGGTFSFTVGNLTLTEGYVSVQSNSLPDSSFTIQNLGLSSSLGYSEKDYHINLRDLSFRVENTKLEQSLEIQTSASASKDKITLEKLIFASGNSVVRSKGYASPVDSTIKFDLSASPISWKDITSYVQDYPLRENAKVDLAISGRPEQFALMLSMEAQGVDSLDITGRFQWQSSLVLEQFQAQAQYLNLRDLFADSTMPSLQELNTAFSGRVDLANYENGQGNLSFSANKITQPPYHLDTISGEGTLENQEINLRFKAQQDQQKVAATLQAKQIWSDLPSVNATVDAANIDPSFLMQDSSYAGDISFQSEVSGQGWYPQKRPWDYSLNMNESRFMGQPIAEFSAKGKVSENNGNLDARMKIRDGTVEISADLENAMNYPSYRYSIKTRGVDLGPLLAEDDFETVVNSTITGSGRGFDPATMSLQTSVSMDSSLVNKEFIRDLSAEISIRNSVATVDSARLRSTIAEGAFGLRYNLVQHFDPGNKLSFDLRLKDMEALAPLVGVDTLHAEGSLIGELNPMPDGNFRFLGNLDLRDVQYNELFTAQRARGSLEVRMQKDIAYLADLDLSAPTFSAVQLQELALKTKGHYADSLARGEYELQFSSPNEGRIEQSASYQLSANSARVRTTEFNIISDYRTLTLERPFEMTTQNDTLRMDTMRVSEGGGAFLEIGVPIISASEQRGYVRGKLLNTSVIQDCLFGKSYFKGLLSGQFEIARKDTNLDAHGELLLSDMEYHDTHFDSLRATGRIANERLDGTLAIHNEGRQLIDGSTDLPFKLGDPESFPPSFFKQPVSGNIRVRDISIERLDSLFADIGITESSGIFSFRGTLSGQAGEPQFTANASLGNATLSGVSVDSVTAGVDYRHDASELELDASVLSLRQRAAQITARIPLFIDMKTFHADLPEPTDSIAVNVETNNFNLQALNDFLDRRKLQKVTGQLDGMVKVQGAMNDLKTDGKLVLKNGGFRLIPAGITVKNVGSTLHFDDNQIRLANLSAKSGNGSLKASGKMALQKLVPGNLEFSVEAQNFRAANTSQYNAVVNVDAEASGTLTNPNVTGSLDVISGFLKLQNFGEKSVETIELDSLENNGPDASIYDSLALDMDVNFDRRFYIRNQRYLEMEIELDGQLDLLKESGGDLQLFGTITTPNGYARPFGKEFKLEEGSVTFSGQPTNPQLMVRTKFEPPQTQEEIVIWYIIEGTVEDPKFKYESQPPMELENIISYTLFGQPFYALDSWKQVVASSGNNTTATDVALEVMLDRVEALATEKLGIDVVNIDNSRLGNETGTSITTGWYLNPKVFFAIQNVITGSTPDTGFLLEYKLRENLKFILRQGNGIRQGVDLKWNYDY